MVQSRPPCLKAKGLQDFCSFLPQAASLRGKGPLHSHTPPTTGLEAASLEARDLWAPTLLKQQAWRQGTSGLPPSLNSSRPESQGTSGLALSSSSRPERQRTSGLPHSSSSSPGGKGPLYSHTPQGASLEARDLWTPILLKEQA